MPKRNYSNYDAFEKQKETGEEKIRSPIQQYSFHLATGPGACTQFSASLTLRLQERDP